MRKLLFSFVALLGLGVAPAGLASEKNCGCECCKGKEVCCCVPASDEASPTAQNAERHPLRGVVVAVQVDDATLTVKHEAIPGVMPAMTMVFKVDPAAAAAAKKCQVITAKMSRSGDDWWLHDIKPVAAGNT